MMMSLVLLLAIIFHITDAHLDIDMTFGWRGVVLAKVNGTIGFVCDNGWGYKECHVVCSNLGYRGGMVLKDVSTTFNFQGYNTVLSGVKCKGTESSLSDCEYKLRDHVNCLPEIHQAGCLCQKPIATYAVKTPVLENSNLSLTRGWHGKVQINRYHALGNIHDNSWGNAQCQVVCGQLGFCGGEFQASSTSILDEDPRLQKWFIDFECEGSELNLDHCKKRFHSTSVQDPVECKCNKTKAPCPVSNGVKNGPRKMDVAASISVFVVFTFNFLCIVVSLVLIRIFIKRTTHNEIHLCKIKFLLLVISLITEVVGFILSCAYLGAKLKLTIHVPILQWAIIIFNIIPGVFITTPFCLSLIKSCYKETSRNNMDNDIKEDIIHQILDNENDSTACLIKSESSSLIEISTSNEKISCNVKCDIEKDTCNTSHKISVATNRTQNQFCKSKTLMTKHSSFETENVLKCVTYERCKYKAILNTNAIQNKNALRQTCNATKQFDKATSISYDGFYINTSCSEPISLTSEVVYENNHASQDSQSKYCQNTDVCPAVDCMPEDCTTTDPNYSLCYNEDTAGVVGLVLIINNEKFEPHTKLEDRNVSAYDGERLKQLWRGLNFDVVTETNLTASATDRVIHQMKEKLLKESRYKCFVCYVLSHGGQGYFHATDGHRVTIKNLLGQFSDEKLPCFSGRPKLFFFQACREITDITQELDESESSSIKILYKNSESLQCIAYKHTGNDVSDMGPKPPSKHFLVSYATGQGCKAKRRDLIRGTLYIVELFEYFRDNVPENIMDLERELKKFIDTFGRAYKELQEPVLFSTLTKILELQKKDTVIIQR